MKFEKHKPEKDLRGVDPKPTTRCKGQSSFLQIWLLGELLEDSEQTGWQRAAAAVFTTDGPHRQL
jgi:hypothetical protein